MKLSVRKWVTMIGWTQVFTAGVFLGIGFVIPSFWFLSIIAIMYLLYVITSEASYRKIVGLVTFAWFIKSLLSISWFWSAYPIAWVAGLSNGVQIGLISTYWLTSSLWLCSGGALFALVSVWLIRYRKLSSIIYVYIAPFLWLIAELFSALLFSVCTAGPGSFLQTYFSFGMTGYLLGVTPFGVWLAVLGGVYGLTILLVAIACASYWLWSFVSKKKWVGSMIALYCILSFVSPITHRESLPISTSVIAVDTQFDAEFLSTMTGIEFKAVTVATAVDAAVKNNPDVIVLPEDSRYLSSQYDALYPNQAMSMFQFTHSNTDTLLIDSGRFTTPLGETVVRANIFDGVSKKIWQIDKQYLVPQGEYVPTVYGVVLTVLGYGAMVDTVAKDSAYRPGPLVQSAELPAYIPGVLFCFESVSPAAVKALLEARTTIPYIVHPISHAWFHNPTILWQQLGVMLQLQARYAGVPIVSAGNMAQGKLYLPNGVILEGTIIEEGDRYRLRQFIF